jgi:predicted transcriptional regulator
VRPKRSVLTDQELEIMKVVWRLGEATVREVYEELLKQRRIAYTTVMTMMGILEEKGYLSKSQGERAYIYRPTQPRQRVMSAMVQEFVNRVFDGSAQPLLLHLVEDRTLTKAELDEIARIMAEHRKAGKDKT